jgi:hypothetical protein
VPKPDIGKALFLELPKEKKETIRAIAMDETAGCLEDEAGRRSYVLLVLPPLGDDYLVSVASYPAGVTLFAPRISLLSAKGAVLRAIPHDALVFRAGALTAEWRHHPGEYYLLIASDPALVGQSISRSEANVDTTVIAGGGVYATVKTGTDRNFRLTYAHNGRLIVGISPLTMPKMR